MMYWCMANNIHGFFRKQNKTQKIAEQWFDNTDDSKSFDAFGDTAAKERIGREIFTGIQRDIHTRVMYGRFIRIAAAVLIFTTLGIGTDRFINERQIAENKIIWSAFSTPGGHMGRLVLSDSTVVYLRPGTMLRAPQQFKGHLRQVQLLEGEAFFEVKHDPERPFTVRSGNIITQVLGTSFLIKNYNQLKNIQVTVATGKVAVLNGKKLLHFLTPHQQLTFYSFTDKYEVETTAANLADDWKSGKYILKNATLKELALQLEANYGVRVNIRQAELQKLTITTQFNMKDNMRDVLEQLELIHHVHYEIKNKEVTLMK